MITPPSSPIASSTKKCYDNGDLHGVPEFLNAISTNNIVLIRKMMSSPADQTDIIKVDNFNRNAIHYFVMYVNNDEWKDIDKDMFDQAIDFLTKFQTNSEVMQLQDNQGLTPLHYASMLNSKRFVESLLKCKVCIETRDKTGKTAMHYAAMYGTVTSMQLMFEQTTEPIFTYIDSDMNNVLHLACLHFTERKGLSYFRCVKLIVDEMAAQSYNIEMQNKVGKTALHLFCINYCTNNKRYNPHAFKIYTLLRDYINVNILDKDNNSALYYAIKLSHVYLGRNLMSDGAHLDINAEWVQYLFASNKIHPTLIKYAVFYLYLHCIKSMQNLNSMATIVQSESALKWYNLLDTYYASAGEMMSYRLYSDLDI